MAFAPVRAIVAGWRSFSPPVVFRIEFNGIGATPHRWNEMSTHERDLKSAPVVARFENLQSEAVTVLIRTQGAYVLRTIICRLTNVGAKNFERADTPVQRKESAVDVLGDGLRCRAQTKVLWPPVSA